MKMKEKFLKEWEWAEANNVSDPEMLDVADVWEAEQRQKGARLADLGFNIFAAIVVTAAVVVIYFSLFIWEH